MSRYAKKVQPDLTLVYGYDSPLQDYFVTLLDENADEDEQIVFNASTTGRLGEQISRDVLYGILMMSNVNQSHIDALILDLPF